jgi:hypothetical protein
MGSGSRRQDCHSSGTNHTLALGVSISSNFAWLRLDGLTKLLDITALGASILL